MGVFDKVSEAQVQEAQYFERGDYVKPGSYLVEVLKAKEGTSRPPKNEAFVVVEMKTLETNAPEHHKIGSTMTWMTMAKFDAFLGNVKHFVMAAGNMASIEDVTKQDLIDAVSEANPLAGVILQLDAVNQPTREGKPFTKVKFTWVANSLQEFEAAEKQAG